MPLARTRVLPISQLVRWKWPGPLLAVARVGAVLTDTGDDAGAKAEGEQAMSDMGNDGTGTSAPQDGESGGPFWRPMIG